MNLADLYLSLAEDCAADGAITFVRTPFAGLTLSWGDLVVRAEAIAARLRDAGIARASRAAVMLADHPDTIPTLLALWRLDAVPVLLDPQWGESIRATIVSHSRADALVRFAESLAVESIAAAESGDRPPLPPNTALMAYTSGSTGSPKGIPLRHDRLVASLQSSAGAVSAFRGDRPARIASSMRLSGFGVLALHYLWSAAFAAEVVVLPRLEFATVGSYWSDLAHHEIDQTVLVPPLFELLLRASRPANERRPLFINGSGPISVGTHGRFMERFGVLTLNCYGLTETTFACTVGDTDARGATTQAVGRPHLLLTRLRAADGALVEGAGEGELELRGPTVSDGYYDNPDADAALFSGRWLRSGDLARRDETGKYWIIGRTKDAVMKGGSTVYLTEVEEACTAVEGVWESVAIRVELPGGNEDLGLIVRPLASASVDRRRLRLALDLALGADRSPRRIVLTGQALPRIGQDKIDRRSAQALWSALTQPAADALSETSQK